MTARSGRAPDPPAPTTLARWRLDPTWSRTVDVAGHDGRTHRWHVLDASPSPARATVVCVHGNPTWAYAWASLLRHLGDRYRVIAIDQLGMGYSERTAPRRYADRVRDLDDVIGALDVDPAAPLVLAAHDWGGAIALGWAVDRPGRVASLILCNTGIAVPEGRSAPGIIRLAASAPLRELVCRRTPAFVEGAIRLSGGRLDAVDREAFRAPYRTAAARAAIADFVGDIPLRAGHPSEEALADVAARLGTLDVPVLLAWGARDPVFDDDFAADLARRLPRTALHRFPDASHLVMAEADVAAVADTWLADLLAPPSDESSGGGVARTLIASDVGGGSDESSGGGVARTLIASDVGGGSDESSGGGVAGTLIASDVGGGSDERSGGGVAPTLIASGMWAALEGRRGDDATAFVDLADGREISFAGLWAAIERVASGLHRAGLRPGERVAMLTPPGVDAVAAIFGALRAGGVTVVADRGLGLRGLGSALGGARPDWVVGPQRALVAARALRWAPRARRLDVGDLLAAEPGALPDPPGPEDPAAVLFTSGATGPAKGVRYLHRQLAAQRDAIADTYGITGADRLVAAFAPFALFGPALGIPTALPDCDVTRPGALTATALDDACRRIGATLAFGSPAALANVVATSDATGGRSGLGALRAVLSAGAPVPPETLYAVTELAPSATLHTPYGMTEVLPVADIAGIEDLDAADPTGGVCVGRPVDGAAVRIVPLGFDASSVPAALPVGSSGEILASAPWMSEGYLGRWHTERHARPLGDDRRWHRTGDVGHVDADGRLWIEGRTVHVVTTTEGPVTSVPVERAVERSLLESGERRRVAAVGVGPAGCQHVVVVVEAPGRPADVAPSAVAATVRSSVPVPVAAVLTLRKLPVDIRHNSKIDRAAVAAWAEDLLAGRRATPPR